MKRRYEFTLSPSEEEIEDLLIQGHSRKEIAALLYKSRHTIEAHIQSIFKKRQVHNRMELLLKVCDVKKR